MEQERRIKGYGVPEECPNTGRHYHVENDRNGVPNAVMAVTTKRKPLADIGLNNEYKPTMNRYEVLQNKTKISNLINCFSKSKVELQSWLKSRLSTKTKTKNTKS